VKEEGVGIVCSMNRREKGRIQVTGRKARRKEIAKKMKT
jgi:hypothetical protein